MLVKEVLSLLVEGESLEELVSNAKAVDFNLLKPYEYSTFRFHVDDYRERMTKDEHVHIINQFSFLPLLGKVSMRSPQVEFSILVDSVTGKHYLGRRVTLGARHLIHKYTLKQRSYLGTTSMDAELALIMANIGKASSGCLVYDPFAGTGSILLAASHFGAISIASDIDGRQMRGSNPEKSLHGNFIQYGLSARFLDSLVFDVLQNPWRCDFLIDAIIADPPYGVRAGARKIAPMKVSKFSTDPVDNYLSAAGSPCSINGIDSQECKNLNFNDKHTSEILIGDKQIFKASLENQNADSSQLKVFRPSTADALFAHSQVKKNPETRAGQYPRTVAYGMDELATDLHAFASKFLRPGGRLVYWYVYERDSLNHCTYQNRATRSMVLETLPKTNHLSLIDIIPQRCRQFDRWLVVLEKNR